MDNKIVILPNDDLIFKYWNEETASWSDDNIKEVNIFEQNKKVYYSVSVPKMAPFSIFTNYNSEFPYNFFKIRRVGKNTILFNLDTKRN